LLKIFQSNLDCKKIIAITIAIEKLIRINRTLNFIFQPHLAGKISTAP